MTTIVQPLTQAAASSYFESFYPGYTLKNFESDGNTTILELAPTGSPICPRCGNVCTRIHDTTAREVRDMPKRHTGEIVFVRFKVRRVRCTCGCCQCEVLSWVEPRARLTNAMVGWVQGLLRLRLSISDVVRLTQLSWSTGKDLDTIQLNLLFDQVDLSGVQPLMIDEFSVRKGHRYATVVMDGVEKNGLWGGMDKSEKNLQTFFDWLPKENRSEQICSVTCDMNAAYPRMVRENLPNAQIVYDLFHVVSNFIRADLLPAKSKARQDCYKRIEIQKRELKEKSAGALSGRNQHACNVLQAQLNRLTERSAQYKSAEWLFARQEVRLDENAKKQLADLREDNLLLFDLHPLADMLQQIWKTKNPQESHSLIETTRRLLIQIAKTHDFIPAKRFARRLLRRAEGIVHAGRFGFSTARLEGANNKIKVIKRVAFGFEDMEYFFLKIKAALPGLHYSPWRDFIPGQAILRSGKVWSCCIPTKP